MIACSNFSPIQRVAGLLGNYNYEPSDDSKGPDGSKAVDGNDIANNWAVSPGTCHQVSCHVYHQ